jgi:hypothetical protein
MKKSAPRCEIAGSLVQRTVVYVTFLPRVVVVTLGFFRPPQVVVTVRLEPALILLVILVPLFVLRIVILAMTLTPFPGSSTQYMSLYFSCAVWYGKGTDGIRRA